MSLLDFIGNNIRLKKGELFKQVPDFGGLYFVSNRGRVYKKQYFIEMPNGGLRKCGDKVLKQDTVKGYKQVTLSFEGFRKALKVHRLVANAFIANPENKPQVNHINGRKQDNSVSNLEWATCSENQLHSVHVLGNYPRRYGKGVHFRKGFNKPYTAQISVKGKKLHLGSFLTEKEAIECYNNFVKENDLC